MTILHYVEKDDVLRDGDLLLVDAGAECEYYASDVTRTFPVGSRFTEEQRALYEVVLAAQMAAIEEVRPGAAFTRPHEVAVSILCEGLLRHGLLRGTVEEVVKRYLPALLHAPDEPLARPRRRLRRLRERRRARVLERDDPDDRARPLRRRGRSGGRGALARNRHPDRGRRARHPGRAQVLTTGIPKTVDEIERARGKRSLEPVG